MISVTRSALHAYIPVSKITAISDQMSACFCASLYYMNDVLCYAWYALRP